MATRRRQPQNKKATMMSSARKGKAIRNVYGVAGFSMDLPLGGSVDPDGQKIKHPLGALMKVEANSPLRELMGYLKRGKAQ